MIETDNELLLETINRHQTEAEFRQLWEEEKYTEFHTDTDRINGKLKELLDNSHMIQDMLIDEHCEFTFAYKKLINEKLIGFFCYNFCDFSTQAFLVLIDTEFVLKDVLLISGDFEDNKLTRSYEWENDIIDIYDSILVESHSDKKLKDLKRFIIDEKGEFEELKRQ